MCSEASKGLEGRASYFRKVCRLTLWLQSEIMTLMGGGQSPLCFQGGLTLYVVQTQPLGPVLLLDHSTQLTQTRKDVFLQRKNSLQPDDLSPGKFYDSVQFNNSVSDKKDTRK